MEISRRDFLVAAAYTIFPGAERSRSAALVIDMQPHFASQVKAGELDKEIPYQLEALEYCRDNDVPIFLVEYDGAGETLEPLKSISDASAGRCVRKKSFDSFENTGLDRLLKGYGIDRILVMGIHDDRCVYETAKTAVELGYEVLSSDMLMAGPQRFMYDFTDGDTAGVRTGTGEELLGLDSDTFPVLSKKLFAEYPAERDLRWYRENTVFRHDFRELLKIFHP